jgi:hypothetical protein
MQTRVGYTFDGQRHPFLMRSINRVGRFLWRFGLRRPLDVDEIMAKACRATGLSDWGDNGYREPLQVLLKSLDETANLTPAGKLGLRIYFTDVCCTRLRIIHSLKTHPEIREQPIVRPLIVVGLPRTGTTLLYNLLNQDHRYRPLLLWEAQQPAPLKPVRPGKLDPRIQLAHRFVRMMDRVAPQHRVVHELVAEGPEECTYLLCNTFLCPIYAGYGNVPAYDEYLSQRTESVLLRLYADYRQQLQLLQWQAPQAPRQWVLKSPNHAWGLDALLTLFPDACVVQTHRNLAQVIPSYCSLVGHLHATFSDEVSYEQLGRRTVETLSQLFIKPILKARAAHPGRVFDVHYADLMKDPCGTVRAIYQFFGIEPEEGQEERIQHWLAEHPHNKHGAHRYTLEQFGLTAEKVESVFADYHAHFNMTPTPVAG